MIQKYELETLTPVHIGTGRRLNYMDGCYENGRWYHIDLDKVLNHPSVDIEALTSEMSQRNFQWQDYLSQRNMNPAEFSNYNLSCPQETDTTEILEAIKTVDNRPYIPGSTLKGALRNELLIQILLENDDIYDKSSQLLQRQIEQEPRGNPNRERPGRQIEKLSLGKDPNHDLLRALQISDTTPIDSDSLEIGMAWTVTLNNNEELVKKIDKGKQYKNFIQIIPAGKRLTFTLKIDEFLFREHEKKQLQFNDLQIETIRSIPKICRASATDILATELEFFDIYDLNRVAQLYIKLEDLNNDLPKDTFLLQIGWGTGYHANTVTGIFANTHDPPRERWLEIQKRFKLGQSRSRRGHYDEREFPKTRRVIYEGQRPIATLGWVKISPM